MREDPDSKQRSLRDMMSLDGRVALVTGGGGHIGAAACEALAELGAGIAVLDKDESCSEVARRVGECFGVDAHALRVDLADEEATRAASEKVVDRFGRLDIVVNNAALTGTGGRIEGWAVPFAEQAIGSWRDAMDVNLTAPFVLSQACHEALAASGHGSIVNVASIYGLVGPDMRLYEGTELGNPAAYAASKGGLLQLTRWLATALAPAIRVNAITPGGLWRDQPDSFHERYIDKTPMRRMACEADLKGAIAYLATDLSSYVTGHNLVVDGGWTAW